MLEVEPSPAWGDSSVFDRILLSAFQTSNGPSWALPDTPVGFLDPGHPALHCYDWQVHWSEENPFLPERIRYRLNERRISQVPQEDINYFFRSGLRNGALFRRFQESQKEGAEYVVQSWTNWAGAKFPLQATLRHKHLDLLAGVTVMDMALVVRVTDIASPDDRSLVPSMLSGSDVQQVFERTCYHYRSSDGSFLSPAEAKATGRVLTPAPPPPAGLRVGEWLWPIRWHIVVAFLALLLTVAAVWLIAWLLSRRG